MSEKFNYFLSSNEISKKELDKLLKENNINGEVLDFYCKPFKKIFVKIKDHDDKNYFIKICLDKYSIELAKNENQGYQELKKNDFRYFNLPNFQILKINNLISISKIAIIEGTKGSFFQFNKFYNFNHNKIYDLLTVSEYIRNLKTKILKSIDTEIPKDLENLMEKLINQKGNLKIPISFAHGDCVHHNSIRSSNKNYLYDLEFYDKKKILFYDFFHWYTLPYIYRIYKLGETKFLIKLFPVYFYFIKKYCFHKFIKKNKSLKNIDINLHFEIFMIERMLYFLKQFKLDNFENLMAENEISFNYKIYNLLNKLLIKISNN